MKELANRSHPIATVAWLKMVACHTLALLLMVACHTVALLKMVVRVALLKMVATVASHVWSLLQNIVSLIGLFCKRDLSF